MKDTVYVYRWHKAKNRPLVIIPVAAEYQYLNGAIIPCPSFRVVPLRKRCRLEMRGQYSKPFTNEKPINTELSKPSSNGMGTLTRSWPPNWKPGYVGTVNSLFRRPRKQTGETYHFTIFPKPFHFEGAIFFVQYMSIALSRMHPRTSWATSFSTIRGHVAFRTD